MCVEFAYNKKHCPSHVKRHSYNKISQPFKIHFNFTIHGAGLNISNKVREAMVVTYYEDGAKLRRLDKNLKEVSDIFLGGKKEGEIADHSINTIVYQK